MTPEERTYLFGQKLSAAGYRVEHVHSKLFLELLHGALEENDAANGQKIDALKNEKRSLETQLHHLEDQLRVRSVEIDRKGKELEKTVNLAALFREQLEGLIEAVTSSTNQQGFSRLWFQVGQAKELLRSPERQLR